MSRPWTPQSGPGSRSPATAKEEWEDWEDDEGDLGADQAPPDAVGKQATRLQERQPSQHRQSAQRIRRLKSRQRQKAQNARAGIKLVTDMSKFRQQHVAHQLRPQSRTGKFVDAAALKALEGAPSDESVGTFAWLKRKPTKGKKAESSPQADLSPNERPIVIGFAMPSDSDVVISPQTAVVETPVDFPHYFRPAKPASTTSPTGPVSAWSPDTEDGASPRELGNTGLANRNHVPAVPSIPRHYRDHDISPLTKEDGFPAPRGGKSHRDTATTPISVSDDDDMATPVTLFEEDGSPATTRRKSVKDKDRQPSATAGSSRSQGWWDQVTSPFGPPTPTPATPQIPSPSQAKAGENPAWWKSTDKKKPLSPAFAKPKGDISNTTRSTPEPPRPLPEIVIEHVPSPRPSSPTPAATVFQTVSQPEKPRVLAEEVQTPGELPPPYSPPSKQQNIRYRAVFPPGHPLNDMYPPSPGPVPPSLAHTMTSQGAINLTDVPLTPPPTHYTSLPDRPPGSFVPADHFRDVTGHGPRQKAERRRRRHEKEDAVAWKAGRLWSDRGCCFPCCGGGGGLGRPGREGRKRRRICLGICAAMLVLTALAVALGVTLSRRTVADSAMPSQWLNLTNFPPIPTGISTVIGPDSDARTACVQPPTLWTCSLPKEQAASVAPFDASQPSFVIQIQIDNNTRQSWNVTGQAPPRPTPSDPGTALPMSNAKNGTRPGPTPTTRSLPAGGGAAGVASLIRRLVTGRGDESGSSLSLVSDPPPPTFQEMFFLGNTTDGVLSAEKAGEPTPFYVSMLRSANDSVGPSVLSRRADDPPLPAPANLTAGQGELNVSNIVPPPALNKDGTGAPAVLLAFPTQQPLRLYDRGLPTERYGFYSYYNKTTYVKSVAPLVGQATSPVPADQNGGCLETEASFVVTWLSVRYKVEIWTRRGNATRLLAATTNGNGNGKNSTRPGSFPYPVTVTLDTHGGPRGAKFAFTRGVDDRQRVVLGDAKLVLNNLNTTGDLVNPAGQFNPSFGGMDGGTGGCRCEYTNWVRVN